MFATIEETDTVVHSHTVTNATSTTEYALVYDGDLECFYFLWRMPKDDINDGRTFENWQIDWKGTYKDVRKKYTDAVTDAVVVASGFYEALRCGSLPLDEEEAIAVVLNKH